MVSASKLVWTAVVCAAHAFAQSSSDIRIDDSKVISDASRYGIQYGPGWTLDDEFGAHYRGTYTSTDVAGSYMMISFRGTEISYYADTFPGMAPVMVALDGKSFPNITWTNVQNTTRSQLLWSAMNLEPGDHQLVLGTAPAYMNKTGTVGIDYFTVTPVEQDASAVPQNLGPGAWAVPVNATIVDNDDPAIKYSDDSWRTYGTATNGPTPLYWGGSQRSSQLAGASLEFTFYGTGVWYFSDDFWGNANVSISVDGGEAEIVNTSTGVTWISQRMFWGKDGLSDGKHTVKVTHVGAQSSYANLDFFMYMPGKSSASHSVSVGVIVGAVVGGVAGLALIALAAFFLIKKRRAAKEEAKSEPTKAAEAGVHHLSLAKTASRGSEVTLDEEKIGGDKAIA
ncbi:transmembrane protein [Ceratobasidium sp. AG-Ba]|nr:transmembrane protein [Ceratobasidium sp. AG-Ba]